MLTLPAGPIAKTAYLAMRLTGKVAVITGAASGIGLESSLLFCQEGCRVLACDVNEKGLKDLIELIRRKSGKNGLDLERIETLKVDVSSEAENEKMVKRAVDLWGGSGNGSMSSTCRLMRSSSCLLSDSLHSSPRPPRHCLPQCRDHAVRRR